MPELPGKLQYRARAELYAQINKSIYEWRQRPGLTPNEMNAFFYGLAVNQLEESSHVDFASVSPSRVWFAIGGASQNGDFQFLDESVNSRTYWQGSSEMRRGDIVLMWCASPRSYLHSIWQVEKDGCIDPFFYYYSIAWLANPIVVPPIPFAEFKSNSHFSTRPAVRAHFQGRGGTAFSVEDYREIKRMLEAKGFDTSVLPAEPASHQFSSGELTDERSVEIHLVEPLLNRLGFVEDDWVRQFSLRMGRGERNYPDYLLGVDSTKGEERAAIVLEVKYQIETAKDLKDAFQQANSYALRLQASVLVLAADRGLWMFERKSYGFDLDTFSYRTWKELENPDALHELSLKIGKRRVQLYEQERNRRKRS